MIYLGQNPVGVSVGGLVNDVQVNGTSVVQNNIANIPIADAGTLGAVTVESNSGLKVNSTTGQLSTSQALSETVKGGTNGNKPICPAHQHESAFYGLAKAAGDSTQASSSNAVGTYTDNAKSAIQNMIGISNILAPIETDTTADRAYAIGNVFTCSGKLYQATAAIAIGDTISTGTNCAEITIADNFINIHHFSDNRGVVYNPSSGYIQIRSASSNELKSGTSYWTAVVSQNNKYASFYGLAQAAGDTSMTSSANELGQYTDSAKSAISTMLNGAIAVSGSTPSITALSGVRYVCGECSTLSITVPANGIIDVTFTSGATATVLTVTPPNGMTIKWANGFNPTSLGANTVYEINIMDGCYGVVGTWT